MKTFPTSFALSLPVFPYFLLVLSICRVVQPLALQSYEVRHNQGRALVGEELLVGFMCKDLRLFSMPHPGKAQHSIYFTKVNRHRKKERENL
ncbi:hypothetical protein NITLEN_11053 [Nitrospira lenta]|uniref:Uncharacterized protein n=1 Tax=Nitrospira lenta TaxID=1436998 RepID=A0A330L3V6_9BACT|nr:hypothetical protein NITLEN_11053 [Nitrospira lenta]